MIFNVFIIKKKLIVLLTFIVIISVNCFVEKNVFAENYFFTFNKALLKNDISLQQRGVTAIERITDQVEALQLFDINSLKEEAMSIEEYKKSPVKMKVSSKIIFRQLNDYAQKLNQQDTLIIYSHTHGVKNYFNENEPWGGLRLDIKGANLPHRGVTIWSDYAEAILSIKAKNIIVLVMACYSGGFIDYLQEINKEWQNYPKEGRNFLIITSQNSNRMSNPTIINDELYNPFTCAVERAFKGQADGYIDGKFDGNITFKEFINYIVDTTHSLDKRAYPQFTGSYNGENVIFTLKK